MHLRSDVHCFLANILAQVLDLKKPEGLWRRTRCKDWDDPFCVDIYLTHERGFLLMQMLSLAPG